tara:strand:+ start:1001 stop:1714 length:714 start_codon:yes stop_codon:yes gene_type:complete
MLGLKLANSVNKIETGYNIYSVDLDGVDAYIDINESKNSISGQKGSCVVWFKLDTVNTSATIWQARVDSSNYVNVFYHNGTSQLRIAYRLGGSTKLASHTVNFENDGKFHHIVATWTPSRIQLYIDGVLETSNTFSGTFTGNFANSFIGQNTLNGNYFHGKIAQLGLFKEVLTDIQVDDIYKTNQEPFDLTGMDNLVAYYKLDEGSGTVALDSSSGVDNGNLINNATYSTSVPYKAG